MLQYAPPRLWLPSAAEWQGPSGTAFGSAAGSAVDAAVSELWIGNHRFVPISEPDASILLAIASQFSAEEHIRATLTTRDISAVSGSQDESSSKVVSRAASSATEVWSFSSANVIARRAGH